MVRFAGHSAQLAERKCKRYVTSLNVHMYSLVVFQHVNTHNVHTQCRVSDLTHILVEMYIFDRLVQLAAWHMSLLSQHT